MLIEYVGDVVRRSVSDIREALYNTRVRVCVCVSSCVCVCMCVCVCVCVCV